MNFESNNPRTSSLINPFYVKDREYNAAYKKMATKCTFPAAFDNGLYHVLVGVWICVMGFSGLAMLTIGNEIISFAIGLVLAFVITYFYGRYMQVKVMFPRGGTMLRSRGNAKTVYWLIPVIFLVGYPIYAIVSGNPLAVEITIGCVYALLGVLAFAKTSRTGLLFLALLLLAIPLLMVYMGFASNDVLNEIVLVSPYEGIVFVMCGIWMQQRAIMPNINRHDRELLKEYLTSGDEKKQFTAASFLCGSVDPVLMPELLDLCQNDNLAVSYTAQVAMGNIWGPKPNELFGQQATDMRNDIPEEYRQQVAEQMEARRKTVHDRWLKHYEIVENTLHEIASENGETQEKLYDLAAGKNVRYTQARVIALEMLGTLRTPRAYSTLMDTLLRKDKKIAIAAMHGFFGADSKSVLYLEKFFVAKSSWIRRRAIRATRYMLDYLAIFDENENAVARALLEPDIDGLFDSEDTTTFAATICLLPGDTEDEIDIIEQYCENSRPLIKVEGLCTLSRLQPERAVNWVLPALNDPSAAVRYAAIKCVAKLRLPQSMDVFRRMSSDTSPRVARLASMNLEKLQAAMRPANPWI